MVPDQGALRISFDYELATYRSMVSRHGKAGTRRLIGAMFDYKESAGESGQEEARAEGNHH
jgi:hypothetical protein